MSFTLLAIFLGAFSYGLQELFAGERDLSTWITTIFCGGMIIPLVILCRANFDAHSSYNQIEVVQRSNVIITDSSAIILMSNGTTFSVDRYKDITILKSNDSTCINIEIQSNIYGRVINQVPAIVKCK